MKNQSLGALLTLPLLLAACGGQPSRVESTTAPVAESTTVFPTSHARKPNTTQKHGGGYYKDDGPGEEIPDNLDDIPDAQPRLEPLHRFANKPYNVLGKAYVPDTSIKHFKQSGIASWYGKKFHGQKTSIGEPYDMFSMTAAHPTLAIPSYVRVTNVSSGKSVVVRVTDRGPFHADRIIDLSYAAAYRLGYVNNGSTLVEIETIVPGEDNTVTYAQVKPPVLPAYTAERDELEILAAKQSSNDTPPALAASTATPTSSAAKGVFLQLGAFSNADNAESLRTHLLRELDWLSEGVQINSSGGMQRVHLGPYANRADAEKVAEKIRLTLGYKPTFVIR